MWETINLGEVNEEDGSAYKSSMTMIMVQCLMMLMILYIWHRNHYLTLKPPKLERIMKFI